MAGDRTLNDHRLKQIGFTVLASTHGSVIRSSWAQANARAGLLDGTLHLVKGKDEHYALFFFPLGWAEPIVVIGCGFIVAMTLHKGALNRPLEIDSIVINELDGVPLMGRNTYTFIGPSGRLKKIVAALQPHVATHAEATAKLVA